MPDLLHEWLLETARKLPAAPAISDLVINYAGLRHTGRIHPGEIVLFASAGIGFTWGVTLARA